MRGLPMVDWLIRMGISVVVGVLVSEHNYGLATVMALGLLVTLVDDIVIALEERP